MFFVQKFVDSEKNFLKLKSKQIHPIFVGPIIATTLVSGKRKKQILVSFGGLTFGKSENTKYGPIMAKIIDSVAQNPQLMDFKVLLAGNPKQLKKIRKVIKAKNIDCGFLSHKEFIKQLTLSKLIIMPPGMTTILESFACKLPAYFLPPQNYSQYQELFMLRKNGLAPKALHWRDIYPQIIIPKGEEKGLPKVVKCIEKFYDDKDAQLLLEKRILAILKLDHRKTVKKQNLFLKQLGGNSAKKIALRIEYFITESVPVEKRV